MEASWYHPRRRLSDYPNLSIVSFFAWVLLHIFIFLFVCHCLYIILIMSSKCIFNGNYCFNSQESVRIHVNYFIVNYSYTLPCCFWSWIPYRAKGLLLFFLPLFHWALSTSALAHIFSQIKVMDSYSHSLCACFTCSDSLSRSVSLFLRFSDPWKMALESAGGSIIAMLAELMVELLVSGDKQCPTICKWEYLISHLAHGEWSWVEKSFLLLLCLYCFFEWLIQASSSVE